MSNYFVEENNRKNKLLTIGKTLEVESVGSNIDLEVSEENKNEELFYSVKDSSVVEVTENGNLISVGEGITTVTVTNKDNTKVQTFVVAVGKEAITEINKNVEKVDELIEEDTPQKRPSNINLPIINITPNNSAPNKNNSASNNNATNKNNNTSSNNTTNKNNNTSNNNTTNKNNNTSSNNTTNKNNNTSSNNTTNNNNNTSSNNTTNKNNTTTSKNVKVTGITLNVTNQILYLNTTQSIKLTETVSPSNATNKGVEWKSSNNSVATVDQQGNVTFVKPGVVTISVTSKDGQKVATATFTIKQKIIFVIGASQVTKMRQNYDRSYSVSNRNYVKNKSLFFIDGSGQGIEWQTSTGINNVDNIIKNLALDSTGKSQLELYILFPLIGNTIKDFVCETDTENSSNQKYKGMINVGNWRISGYADNYANSIQYFKDMGYTNTNGYVISMHPVRPDEAKAKNENTKTVPNSDSNACKFDYRSNWKYYKFNTAMKKIIESNQKYKNLKYIPLFSQIMNTSTERQNFTFKIRYATCGEGGSCDGVHWNKQTTITYVNMMLNSINGL